MSCEIERSKLSSAELAASEKAAYCAGICGSLGHESDECAGCQAELQDARDQVNSARAALAACQGKDLATATQLIQTWGQVTFLLVVEQGMGYGGGLTNWIDADVIFKLDTSPDRGFGFQLRDDPAQPVRRACCLCYKRPWLTG